jgi:hypothetical protein
VRTSVPLNRQAHPRTIDYAHVHPSATPTDPDSPALNVRSQAHAVATSRQSL